VQNSFSVGTAVYLFCVTQGLCVEEQNGFAYSSQFACAKHLYTNPNELTQHIPWVLCSGFPYKFGLPDFVI